MEKNRKLYLLLRSMIKRGLTGPRKLEIGPVYHRYRRSPLGVSLVQGFCGKKEGRVNTDRQKRGDERLSRTDSIGCSVYD